MNDHCTKETMKRQSKKSSPKLAKRDTSTGGDISILKTGPSTIDYHTWSVIFGALFVFFGFIVFSLYPAFTTLSFSHSKGEMKRNKSGIRIPELQSRARWHEQTEITHSRRCDLSVIQIDKLTKEQIEDLDVSTDPVLIRGGMLNWPSKNSPSWNLPSFLAAYGNRTVHMASSHELAYKINSNSPEKVQLAEVLLS